MKNTFGFSRAKPISFGRVPQINRVHIHVSSVQTRFFPNKSFYEGKTYTVWIRRSEETAIPSH